MRIFSLILWYLLSGMLPVCDVQAARETDDADRLRANIIALDRVQNNIRKTLTPDKIGKNISSREEHEILIFIDYLQQRNQAYCEQLEKRVGHAAMADLPCPEKPAILPRKKAPTAAEELAELDRQLAVSLGEFDEMLLKEQERIAARRPRQRETGGTGGNSGPRKNQGNASATMTSGSQKANRQRQTSGRHGRAAAGTVNRAQQDRLNSDDDIVARQLREAAEKETDPRLKEKLWQEYRKYKAGI